MLQTSKSHPLVYAVYSQGMVLPGRRFNKWQDRGDIVIRAEFMARPMPVHHQLLSYCSLAKSDFSQKASFWLHEIIAVDKNVITEISA